jgi:hypothetical protein
MADIALVIAAAGFFASKSEKPSPSVGIVVTLKHFD